MPLFWPVTSVLTPYFEALAALSHPYELAQLTG
jgi:hypothetical protein